jgi:hypothetical protein
MHAKAHQSPVLILQFSEPCRPEIMTFHGFWFRLMDPSYLAQTSGPSRSLAKARAQKPSYVLLRSGVLERVYMVYLYVKDPEEILTLRPRITEEVFKLWDKQKQT